MAKKTYQEKLLDPRWQRKRLEALEKADFHCEMCGDGESTLHVHHKQYIKGWEPWEYDADQLCVLCKNCHSSNHECDDQLNLSCSFASIDGPYGRDSCASLVAGYLDLPMHEMTDPELHVFGMFARKMQKHRYDLIALHDWSLKDGYDIDALIKIFSVHQKSVEVL